MYYRDIYTAVIIIVLLTVAKLWSQPRCPTTWQWVRKICECLVGPFFFFKKKTHKE